MAERVVDDLEVVEVEEQDDRDRARRHRPTRAAGPRSGRRTRRFASPVRASWIGLVLELFLEVGQRASDCSSWPFSSATAVWLASVSNSLQLVEIERAEVAQPVGDDDRAHQARLADERRVRSRCGIDRRLPSGARRLAAGRLRKRPALGDALHAAGVVERRGRSVASCRPRFARSHGRPQDLLALRSGQERDLRDLGPEHLAGVVEQGDQRAVHLRDCAAGSGSTRRASPGPRAAGARRRTRDRRRRPR